jgi:hypothetical protein
MHLAARANTFDGLVYLISHAWRQMRVFHAEKKRTPKTEDSLAERGEFELSVPICEHSREQHQVKRCDIETKLQSAIVLQRISSAL